MFKKYLFSYISENYLEFYFNFLIRNYDEFNSKFIREKEIRNIFQEFSCKNFEHEFIMFDWILDSEIGFLQNGIVKFTEFRWIDDEFYRFPISINGTNLNWSKFLEYCLQFEEIKQIKITKQLKENSDKFIKLEQIIKQEIVKNKQEKYLQELKEIQEKEDYLTKQNYML